MLVRSIGCCLLVATLTIARARADAPAPAAPPAYAPPEFLSRTPPLPAALDAPDVWRLQLAEALQIALRQNLGIVVERGNLRISSSAVALARGPFEPVLSARYGHDSARIPPSTLQEGGAGQILEYRSDDWRVSLGQRLSTGMMLSLDFANQRSRSALGTAVAPLNYRSTLALSAIQPLLRGFSPDLVIPQLPILQARLRTERDRRQLEVAMIDVVERTESTYWDLVQALYQYDLEALSQRRADEQLELTRRQIDAGVLPPADVIAAESTVAQRRLRLVQAEQTIQLAWDRLRAVLNVPREAWARPILPTDVPVFTPATLTADEALAAAVTHRPELNQLALDIEQARLAVRRAENEQLPQIDLGVSAVVIGQDSSYPPALSQLGGIEARGWNVFVNLSWTPLQRAASAAAEIERTRHELTRTRREQAIQDIWFAVRDAVRNQRTAARQVDAAARFRSLAEQNLELEQRKFLSGTSSNFVVAQRQEELAAAQLAEVSAVVGHSKASVSLSRATGRLLADRNIQVVVGPR
jgi:outer membrane protein